MNPRRLLTQLGLFFAVLLVLPPTVRAQATVPCHDATALRDLASARADDPRWGPLFSALRAPLPAGVRRNEVVPRIRAGHFFDTSPTTHCPALVVEYMWLLEGSEEAERYDHVGVLGVDTRGRVVPVVRDLAPADPLRLADPRIPDVDADGWSEHFEVRVTSEICSFQSESGCAACGLPLTYQARLVASRGTILSDWFMFQGLLVPTEGIRALQARASQAVEGEDGVICAPPPSYMELHRTGDPLAPGYRVADVRRDAGGAYAIEYSSTLRNCEGWLADPSHPDSPRCQVLADAPSSAPLRLTQAVRVVAGSSAPVLVYGGPVLGTVPADELAPEVACPGFYSAVAYGVVTLPASAEHLRLMTWTSGDGVMAVRRPDGSWTCDDDGARPHPVVDLRAASPGDYWIYVGKDSSSGDALRALVAATTDRNWAPSDLVERHFPACPAGTHGIECVAGPAPHRTESTRTFPICIPPTSRCEVTIVIPSDADRRGTIACNGRATERVTEVSFDPASGSFSFVRPSDNDASVQGVLGPTGASGWYTENGSQRPLNCRP